MQCAFQSQFFSILQEEQKKYYCGTLRRTGACSYGDDCRYNHDIPVDNKQSEAEASPQPVTDSASDLAMDTK